MSSPVMDLTQCAECGHDHFHQPMRAYQPCPLADEGCQCPFAQGDACPEVYELRARLDSHGLYWMPVRTYPNATYLPEETHHSIWWIESEGYFLWGHNYEYQDKTVDEVLARLKELGNA